MRQRKFVKLYNKFHQPILRFVYFRVNSREIAEDLTADVFLRSFNYFKKFKPDNARAVLYKIARNTIIDYYRKNRKIRFEQETKAEDKHFLDLHKALDQIKEEHKEIIILYYFEGLSSQEIAEIVNKKENSVNIILHRARKKLKELM